MTSESINMKVEVVAKV